MLHSAVDSVLSLMPASGLDDGRVAQAAIGRTVESIATTILKGARDGAAGERPAGPVRRRRFPKRRRRW